MKFVDDDDDDEQKSYLKTSGTWVNGDLNYVYSTLPWYYFV